MSAAGAIVSLGRLIRVSHTVFSVPFALVSASVAMRESPLDLRRALLILACLASARTAAMGYNRIADRTLDAANPRTAGRELPRGTVTLGQAWALTAISLAVFLAAAYALSPLCGLLALPTAALALGYSHAKRFTWLCHFWLGLVLGLAPVGAWLAITGTLSAFPLLLGLGVLFWISGFDVTYGLADLEFDRGHGLRSFPVRFGPRATIVASRLLHLAAAACFLAAGIAAGRGPLYLCGVLACAGSLVWGQLATARGARGDAVLTANGWAALLFGALALGDVLLGRLT